MANCRSARQPHVLVAVQVGLVAAVALGAIERLVGADDRFAGRRFMRLAAGGADAHRYLRLFMATEAQLFDAAADAFGEKQQLVVAGRVRYEYAKLLAAESGAERRATNRLLQQRSDLDQHLVARFVAKRIVDAFEVVEVEHQR